MSTSWQTPSIAGLDFSPYSNQLIQYLLRLIKALDSAETQELALALLAKNQQIRGELAPLLWHSVGTMTVLLQVIISAYPKICIPNLTERDSRNVRNVLSLLQGVAAHPITRLPFVQAKIPAYVYPFLSNPRKETPQESLRLISLGVIGTLVKVDDVRVIRFLLESQVLPCCLRSMEVGNGLSQTVATFIVYKILKNNQGMNYCCAIAERFFSIGQALGNMIEKFSENQSKLLLKLIICCYHSFSETPRARECLRMSFPVILTDSRFINILRDDEEAMQSLQKFFQNITQGVRKKQCSFYRGNPAEFRQLFIK